MPYNGSGTFNRVYDWTTDRDNGLKINATRMDAEMDGMATGLSTAICKDGQTTATNNLPMGGYIHTGVGSATARNQYAQAAQVQDAALIWCSTSGGTANAQTLSPTPAITSYAAGQHFAFIPGATNTGATTVAVSGLSTKNIKKFIGAALVDLAAGDLRTSTVAEVRYDNTQFVLLNPQPYSHGADIASATTTDLDAATGDLVDVTGTTTITAITLTEGRERTVRFTGALTLTHGASLVLPGAANITTAAGDYAVFRGYASGVVRCVAYTKASGLGVAGMAAQAANNVSISGGTVTGVSATGLTSLTVSGSASPGVTFTQTAQSNNGFVQNASNASYDGNMIQASSTRAASTAFRHIEALANGGSDPTFRARGDGTITADVSFTGGGADYAEYFESAAGGAIAVGTSVVLEGRKVRAAMAGDPPGGIIGVVRPKLGAAGVIGNAAELGWQGKFQRDDYGGLALEPNGDLKRSAAYNAASEYSPRSERPEWCLIGLLGQVRLTKGQPTGERWILMREVSASVEEWFIR